MTQDSSKRCIFLAEDDDMTRHTLVMGLKFAGYAVCDFPDGKMAFECLGREGHAPDLMITDLKMPGMDGVRLTNDAREMYPCLPVVVMTGFGDEAVSRDFQRVEGLHFISKPFCMDAFLGMVSASIA